MNMPPRDRTRLKNLLRNYRDHMITKYFNSMKHIPIDKIIETIDDAIQIISLNL
ncbi:hypothetical protein LCGC14_2325370 [marine sediment metagenome]|uniref:Uncharacterized protein n=1 Tax=marine sediment metagenome TaxID=412755 RepID=A0A0F9E1E5_9ZZZZ